MGITDKITGRVKKAAGDLTDDASLRREGRQEERKGEAKDELANAQERADAKADEVADLERKTAERHASRRDAAADGSAARGPRGRRAGLADQRRRHSVTWCGATSTAGRSPASPRDVDLGYFDPEDLAPERDRAVEAELRALER